MYSPDLYFAAKQSIGILSIGLFCYLLNLSDYITLPMTAGAWCVSATDNQTSNKRSRAIDMIVASLLGAWTSFVISLTSTYPILCGLLAIGFIFVYSMFNVFGQRTTAIAYGCSLLMILTMRNEYPPNMAISIALYTLLGCIVYCTYSMIVSYFLRRQEDRKILARAIFATAKYINLRSKFYDINNDLEDCYRQLRPAASDMVESQTTARYVLSRTRTINSKENILLWNIYSDVMELLNTMVSSQTDYRSLREVFKDNDILLFMRDTLSKLSLTLDEIAQALTSGQAYTYRNTAKAELRALEYEILQQKEANLNISNPDLYLLLIRIVRRLRNATSIINRMSDHLRNQHISSELTEASKREKHLAKKMTSSPIVLKDFFTNLNIHSVFFRYALRVTIAFAVVWAGATLLNLYLGHETWVHTFGSHIYWVNITLILVLRPGYSLTRQRIGYRLIGTMIGCLIVIGLFVFAQNNIIYLVTLVLCMIIGKALAGSGDYRISVTFITIYVLLGFHFLLPESKILFVGERAFDTFLACVIGYICSMLFPYWECDGIDKLAKKAIQENYLHFCKCLDFAKENLGKQVSTKTGSLDTCAKALNAQVAFSNSLTRMLNEPKSHQKHIEQYNSLVTHGDSIYNLIPFLISELESLSEIPSRTQAHIEFIKNCLNLECEQVGERPTLFDTADQYQGLIYPLKQLQLAAIAIRQRSEELHYIDSPNNQTIPTEH
ncbi:hypothetical protein IX83_01835 [Basilea psittacipulmonis DSM 24701]|uniref:Uncharacterized protein n=1 Tax=Basilea psittacipulmonis DSM 24701 TaxID=1072685 RepID=A0A077DGG0_9BURK|nr:hypothetical protein IX83_01835 [Basilea psittacipulmonis DSM 24701]